MKYIVSFHEVVIKKHIPALPNTMKGRIKSAIEERIALDPISFGKPLRYGLKGYRRTRVGDYRIVYRVEEDTHMVKVIAIQHRKDIYEE